MKLPALVFALVAATAHTFAAPTDAADRTALLKDVSEISVSGTPGGVCAFGPAAFAVVAGKAGEKTLLPVVAAARWEKGRVVAFGHDGFLASVNESGTGTLLANAARWAGGDAAKPKVGVFNNAALLGHLKTAGLDPVALDGELPKSKRPKNDDEERDQWLVRFSRACGKNLGPFFEAWGVPTSESVRQSIADLPGWMPADWPKL